jgi:hypothetical protein
LTSLVFVSRLELDHVIGTVYPDVIRPILIRRAAEELGLPPYKVAKIAASPEFRALERKTLAGPFSFRKELADQAENELKGFVPRGGSLSRHAPMTQNPFMKADPHDTTASSAHRSFL